MTTANGVSPLLEMGIVHCDATARVEHLCRGWFRDGWRFHACAEQPGHKGPHRCACSSVFEAEVRGRRVER